jgi:hypothetical protein
MAHTSSSIICGRHDLPQWGFKNSNHELSSHGIKSKIWKEALYLSAENIYKNGEGN